jgi:hypothetical protein
MNTYQEYRTPADVIATKADFAPDRKLVIPSSVRVGISLAISYES